MRLMFNEHEELLSVEMSQSNFRQMKLVLVCYDTTSTSEEALTV